ncbi:unnamed protein product, partial [Ilex paraguariensis]
WPNEVTTNTNPIVISTTVDAEVVDHRSNQEIPSPPVGNNVWDSSPIPKDGRPSNGQLPSKHMSVLHTKPTPAKPWSQVLMKNAIEKSNSLHQHPFE